MTKRRKSKTGTLQHIVNRYAKGLIIRWSDPNPLSGSKDASDLFGMEVTHRNPTHRLYSMDLWRGRGKALTNQVELCWKIRFTPIFVYPNRMEQGESRLVVARGKMFEIAHACEEPIRESLRHGAHLEKVQFEVECLGNRSVRESDWEDYEDGYLSEVELCDCSPPEWARVHADFAEAI